jgi:hypothetical protein
LPLERQEKVSHENESLPGWFHHKMA